MQTKRRSPVSCRRKWAYLVEHGALGSLYSTLPVAMGRPNRNNRGNDDSQVDCAASAPDPLHAPDQLETEPSVAENSIVVAEWSRRIPDHGTHSGSAHRSALGQHPVGPTDQRCAAIRGNRGGAAVTHLSGGATIHPDLSGAGQLPAACLRGVPSVIAHLALPEPPLHSLHYSGGDTDPFRPPASDS